MSNFLIRELNAVFIHIPKTGGTSLRKGVFKQADGPYYGELPPHSDNLFKFAFVREPIDRFLSCVSMFYGGSIDEDGKQRRKKSEAFSLSYAIEILSMSGLDFGAGRTSLEEKFLHHALPMTHPFNMLEAADFIGRFENLNSDFASICSICHISDPPTLPHLHQALNRITAADLSPSQLIFLKDYYYEDYALTKYDLPRV